MKKVFFGLICFLSSFVLAHAEAGEIVLEGTYQGKNLYVQNPFTNSGVGFCVYEVRINNQVTTDEVNSSAFEVDFLSFQLAIGAPVVVTIKHKDGCRPRVLNPEVIKPKASFVVVGIACDAEGNLTWKTTNEAGPIPYVVEQYRWNKWVTVGTVQGKGTPSENKYSFKVTPHSGKNKVRIKQVDYLGSHPSTDVPFNSKVLPVTFAMKDNTEKTIIFKSASGQPAETMYEIFDGFGNVVKKGFGSSVDISSLQGGKKTYYINFDKETQSFVKK
ncbi:MAG: hypothetical protein NT150_13470 [Bacteroidetes bacterium]|nr:hypothetical protein [Bacteroidota bacterium]